MEQLELKKYHLDKTQGSIFIKNITMLDYAIFDHKLGIIGNSLEVDITVSGERNDKGFVIDFSHLKSITRKVLKDTIDHALVIPTKSQFVKLVASGNNEHWTLKMENERYNFDWQYICPKGSVYQLASETINNEILEQEIAKIMLNALPATVNNVEIKLHEANYNSKQTFFRYTHGLPKHEGLCQRLFHGHKSQIEVYISGKKRQDLEQWIVNEFFNHNVHIATHNQVLSGKLETRHRFHNSIEPIQIKYEGNQGTFEAIIPADKIFTIADDTSIESLTWQLAYLIKEKLRTEEEVMVLCYEGINKGSRIVL